MAGTRHNMTATPIQKAAAIVAIAFLAVGVLGFIPRVTTDFDRIEFAGHESGAELLGLFQVSVLHNIVHLGFGAIGLFAIRTAIAARNYLIGGGIVYLVLWVYGLIIDTSGDANFVPLNDADDWLHLGLGAAMILSGVVLSRRRVST
jgi:hypothetical protein